MAAAKAQALPSIIDERFAKNRKASLATQKKSRDFSCGLSFSFCMVIMLWVRAQAGSKSLYLSRKELRPAQPAASESPSL
jgi:hypothetical protein